MYHHLHVRTHPPLPPILPPRVGIRVFTYVLVPEPVHKDENCLVKWLLTLPGHTFVHNGPILSILVSVYSQG